MGISRRILDANVLVSIGQTISSDGFAYADPTAVRAMVPARLEDLSSGLAPEADYSAQSMAAQYPIRITFDVSNVELDGDRILFLQTPLTITHKKDFRSRRFKEVSAQDQFVVQYLWDLQESEGTVMAAVTRSQ